MDDKYIIALSDASGACYLLATEISSNEEVKRLDAFMRRWTPEPSKACGGKSVFSEEDLLASLRKLTGYTFYPVVANYSCSYQGQNIDLPSLVGKKK